MPRCLFSLFCCLALLWPAAGAHAQVRAWLDRDRIALGETATLNVESEQAGAPAPDWSPLERDFRLSAHTSTRQVEIVNGRQRARTLHAVALEPRRAGELRIPALAVGSATTAPLTLSVGPPDSAPARAGEPAFIESELDVPHGYVQQAIGYTLRLHYATPLISGELEQPAPEGASLQRIGSDVQYTRELGGRRYTVVERRFMLVPDRSGTLTLPGARFTGRGTGSFFDEIFGDGSRLLSAHSAPRMLEIRPIPDQAPQPWLPLRALELTYLSAPQRARAGEAVEIVVEARADGASGGQLPPLELQVDGGAQVFPEPPEIEERFEDGRPQVRATRRFSVVPAQAGTVRVRGPRLAWWDVRADAAREAALPDLRIEVAAGAVAAAPAQAPAAVASRDDDDDAGWIRVPGVQEPVRPWALATVVFALLWLVTLAWGLYRRPASPEAPRDGPDRARAAGNGGSEAQRLRALRQVLDTGDLGEVASALCGLSEPPAADLDALRARLAEPAQVAAVEALQRARWADGDVRAARAAVREAFRHGPRWRTPAAAEAEAPPLPPLYPP
ncbi:BatD family protein [Luteimonas huabeiensis]|uniref:BatD family protein n=1 Tax=Luteimonas huabeiensis TaxID=1244513 RepID=UPI00046520D1|nr:BatD family protein [Luteimonas huabeiensis]